MTTIYTPPPFNNVVLIISNTTYTQPIPTQITINLLILIEPIPIVQNAFFLL